MELIKEINKWLKEYRAGLPGNLSGDDNAGTFEGDAMRLLVDEKGKEIKK